MAGAQQVPIYLINLDRRPDRLAFMAAQLEAMGLAFTRFPAIDATTTSDEQIGRRVDSRAPMIRMPRGSKCGALSHIAVWEMIAAGKARAGIVLEDDMELSRDLAALAAADDWLPAGTDLVQLERKGSARPKLMGPTYARTPDGRELRQLHSRSGGAGAYVITRDTARCFVATAGLLRFPIDHLLFNANISRLARRSRIAAVVPALARQRREDFASDITPAPYRTPFVQRLLRGWYEINLLPGQVLLLLSGRARAVRFDYSAATQSDVFPAERI